MAAERMTRSIGPTLVFIGAMDLGRNRSGGAAFGALDEKENGERDGEQHNEPDERGDAGDVGQADFAERADGQDIFRDPRKTEGVERAADEETADAGTSA